MTRNYPQFITNKFINTFCELWRGEVSFSFCSFGEVKVGKKLNSIYHFFGWRVVESYAVAGDVTFCRDKKLQRFDNPQACCEKYLCLGSIEFQNLSNLNFSALSTSLFARLQLHFLTLCDSFFPWASVSTFYSPESAPLPRRLIQHFSNFLAMNRRHSLVSFKDSEARGESVAIHIINTMNGNPHIKPPFPSFPFTLLKVFHF